MLSRLSYIPLRPVSAIFVLLHTFLAPMFPQFAFSCSVLPILLHQVELSICALCLFTLLAPAAEGYAGPQGEAIEVAYDGHDGSKTGSPSS